MREILIQDDVTLVETKIKQFEENTGCELLMVITNASDPYPAAAWRFGVLAGLVLSLVFSHYFDFHISLLWPLSFFIITLLMTWIGHYPWAKKIALSHWEVNRECNEKAVEFFHTLGTSKVTHQVTAMIMISVLEKKIIVLIDEKLKTKIEPQELEEVIVLMKKHFKDGNMGLGIVNSIQTLESKILGSFQGKVCETTSSQLKDTIQFIRI